MTHTRVRRDVFELASNDPFLSVAKTSIAAMMDLLPVPVGGVYDLTNGLSYYTLQQVEDLCSGQRYMNDPCIVSLVVSCLVVFCLVVLSCLAVWIALLCLVVCGITLHCVDLNSVTHAVCVCVFALSVFATAVL